MPLVHAVRGFIRRFQTLSMASAPYLLPNGHLPDLPETMGLPADSVIAFPASGQRVYRIVGSSASRERDFESFWDRCQEKGWELLPDDSLLDALAVSMFASERQALDNADNWPKFVQPVRLVEGRGLNIARTDAHKDGHYNVWGSARTLLDCVEGLPQRHNEPD